MVSFDAAVQLGCDLFETDLRLSKDEQVVLIHDPVSPYLEIDIKEPHAMRACP